MEFEQMVAKTPEVEQTDREAAIAELTGTTESITPEIKQETAKPIAKETAEEVKETPKDKSEEEIRKEVEREMKHKYLSQVSIKAKEVEAERAKRIEAEQKAAEIKAKYDNGEVSAEEYIESMVDVKLQKQNVNTQEKQIQELESYEKSKFLEGNNDVKPYLEQLEKIISDNPNLSWTAAKTLYLAMNNPEALVKKTTNLDLGGNPPKSVFNPELSLDDLKKLAEEESAQWNRY